MEDSIRSNEHERLDLGDPDPIENEHEMQIRHFPSVDSQADLRRLDKLVEIEERVKEGD